MMTSVVILVIEALVVYLLVLTTHSLRSRFGLSLFYALMGGITAVMSWITDAGVTVQLFGITFMVGSTVFYTSLLLGVFVVYVFDGPRATRMVISTVIGVSILVPLITAVLHFQMRLADVPLLSYIPVPSLRINAASVIATFLDLVFLAIMWETLGRHQLKKRLLLRTFLTLLGVMWLDVFLFATGAFAGTEGYFSIITGTLLSRLVISTFASPVLWGYLKWQNAKTGSEIESRPVHAILQQFADMTHELSTAQKEIAQRRAAEKKLNSVIAELNVTISEVRTLRGFLPICASCKKIRNDDGYWEQIEKYITEHSDAQFSHGLCPDCLERLYPEDDQGGDRK